MNSLQTFDNQLQVNGHLGLVQIVHIVYSVLNLLTSDVIRSSKVSIQCFYKLIVYVLVTDHLRNLERFKDISVVAFLKSLVHLIEYIANFDDVRELLKSFSELFENHKLLSTMLYALIHVHQIVSQFLIGSDCTQQTIHIFRNTKSLSCIRRIVLLITLIDNVADVR